MEGSAEVKPQRSASPVSRSCGRYMAHGRPPRGWDGGPLCLHGDKEFMDCGHGGCGWGTSRGDMYLHTNTELII